MMGWGYGMGGGGWLLMTALWFVMIVVVVAAVTWIFPRATSQRVPPPTSTAPTFSPPTSAAPTSTTARQILDERLARGEIDVETYRTLRDELTRTAL
jgi:putative membrane protein